MKHIDLQSFDAVAFDVEGTLADTIPTHHQARLNAFAQHGYGHITREQHELGPTYGSTTSDIVGGILHTAGAIEKTGPFKDHPTVQEVVATRTKIFGDLAAAGFQEMPGAIEFVHRIAKYFPGKMALVTSSPERFIMPFVEHENLMQYFPHNLIISGDTVHEEGLENKPAPDPFRLAMQRLGARKLLVFEDTVSGAASAKQAGATVIALGFDKHNAKLFASSTLPYPPDAVVANYAEAAQLLGMSA
jgi:beta-phosphoglucomutase-like phosphatase (HAD superfamily)